MKHEHRSIPIAQIDIPADRLREVNPDRVETLSKDIAANGLLQPIGVIEEESGGLTLTYGLHRLEAIKALKHHEIEARVQPRAWIRPGEDRLQEIMENLNREGLTKLQRAENLAELKRVHEAIYPETKNGGDPRTKKAKQAAKGQKEIFSFRAEAAERTGLSVRAINGAVAIVTNLAEETKARLRGTWIADHQASLKALSEQPAEMQAHVCDLMLATPPEAASVADAVLLAMGKRPPAAAEKLFASVTNNFARLTQRQRHSLFELHEDAVRAYAQEKGWL